MVRDALGWFGRLVAWEIAIIAGCILFVVAAAVAIWLTS
jgi:hypothetical protein